MRIFMRKDRRKAFIDLNCICRYLCVCVCVCVCVSAQAHSYSTLHNPMDCSLPGSSIHGISQARTVEWVVISFSRHLPSTGIEPASLPLLHWQVDSYGCITQEAPRSSYLYYLPLISDERTGRVHVASCSQGRYGRGIFGKLDFGCIKEKVINGLVRCFLK